MNECLCESCDEWFVYSEENCVKKSDSTECHWYCDDCLDEFEGGNKDE